MKKALQSGHYNVNNQANFARSHKSTEALGFEPGKVYDIKTLKNAYLKIHSIDESPSAYAEFFGAKNTGEFTDKDQRKELVTKLREYIDKNCSVVNYSEMNLQDLLGQVESAKANLPYVIKLSNALSSGSKEKRRSEQISKKRLEKSNDDLKNAKDIASAAHAEKMSNVYQDRIKYDHDDRFMLLLCKQVLHLIIMSCKALDTDLNRRGFKSEF